MWVCQRVWKGIKASSSATRIFFLFLFYGLLFRHSKEAAHEITGKIISFSWCFLSFLRETKRKWEKDERVGPFLVFPGHLAVIYDCYKFLPTRVTKLSLLARDCYVSEGFVISWLTCCLLYGSWLSGFCWSCLVMRTVFDLTFGFSFSFSLKIGNWFLIEFWLLW